MRRRVGSIFGRIPIGWGSTAVVVALGFALSLSSPRAEAGSVAMPLSQIGAGMQHSCGISVGKAYCWGSNGSGELGNNSTTEQTTPVAVDTSGVLAGKTISMVSAGKYFSCALTTEGKAYCWGGYNGGVLGDGSGFSTMVPVAVDTSGVLAGKTLAYISAGFTNVCAIDTAGKAYCWGQNSSGELGNGTYTGSGVPVAVDTSGVLAGRSLATIGVSETNVCALTTDGVGVCWGDSGGVGQLGSSISFALTPAAVDTSGSLAGKTVSQLSVGGAHSCVLASDGNLYCWGFSGWGQRGDGTMSNVNTPAPVTMTGLLSDKTVSILDAGYENTCVKVTTGELYCWGMGRYGEIGNGATDDRYLVPSAVTMSGALSGRTVNSIDVGLGDQTHGAGSVCATTLSGRAYCWGRNDHGQLGIGSTTDGNLPALVIAPANLSAGSYRVYQNANSLTPGAPLAATDTAPQLPAIGAAFRLRTGVSTTSGDLGGANTFKLQFVKRSAATCSAQTTGFADVTASTEIAWNSNAGATNGAAISTTANDPTANGTTTAQIYQSAAGTFGAPADTPSGNSAMWDFSLKDNGATANSDYCFRIVYASGSALEAATAYPQIKTAASSVIDVAIVNSGGTVVASPTYALTTATVKSTCQAITGNFATSAQRIRVTNTAATNGWSLSLAPSGGATDLWDRSDSAAKYDFNDPSGSPAGCNSGSDGDGYAGQLSVNPSGATLAAKSGCNTTGISEGSSSKYNQGTTDAITLMTSSSAATGCYWDMYTVAVSQQIPPGQPSGVYTLNMTLTVVAQ